MKVFGIVLSFAAVFLISSISIATFYIIIPLVTPFPTIGFFWHFFVGTYVVFAILFNYLMCSLTSPGNPPKEWLETVEQDIESLKKDQETVKGKSWSKFCKQCQKPKPSRAHHCHICDKCITRMDHQ